MFSPLAAKPSVDRLQLNYSKTPRNQNRATGATELNSDKSARKAAVLDLSLRWRHFTQNGGAFTHIEAEAPVFEGTSESRLALELSQRRNQTSA